MNEPSPEVQRRVTLLAFETMLQVQAANGSQPHPEVKWLLTALSLNCPQGAARLRRVLGVLTPEVRAAVLRLAAAEQGATVSPPTPRHRPGLKVMTARQAATAIGIETASVRRALQRGALTGVKDSAGEWRIDAESVEAYRRGSGG